MKQNVLHSVLWDLLLNANWRTEMRLARARLERPTDLAITYFASVALPEHPGCWSSFFPVFNKDILMSFAAVKSILSFLL